MKNPSFRQGRSGFTLVELLIVIAIIGILAAFTVMGVKSVNRRKAITTTQAELGVYQSALEAYHKKYSVYPPSNGYGNPLLNQLYYELSGTTNTGSSFVTLDGNTTTSIPVNSPGNDVSAAYKVGGFINCDRGGGEDIAKAENFLPGLKPNQFYFPVNNQSGGYNVPTAILITAARGPDEAYRPLGISGVNPIRYVCPGTNNPNGYDLWIDLSIGGKTNRISNWSQQVQIVP